MRQRPSREIRKRRSLLILLVAVLCFVLLVLHDLGFWTPGAPNQPPDWEHWLGTDALGRDRVARVVAGYSLSLLACLLATTLCSVISLVIGFSSGWFGDRLYRSLVALGDLTLCLPWLFVLLILRGALPLDTSPLVSLACTYAVPALLAWPMGARVIAVAVKKLSQAPCVMQARASGVAERSLLIYHVLPALKPVLRAQFWVLIPLFMLSEANLGLLGLGPGEPMPSVGSLLRELTNELFPWHQPWLFAPVVLLVTLLLWLHHRAPRQEWVQ